MQALICLDSPEHQDVCQQLLQSLGYTADVMPNQFKALEYLREVPYRLFVLDAAFDGTSLDTNLVLTFLRERPLDQRRYQFVVLCAPELATADPMTAYSQSVNLVHQPRRHAELWRDAGTAAGRARPALPDISRNAAAIRQRGLRLRTAMTPPGAAHGCWPRPYWQGNRQPQVPPVWRRIRSLQAACRA